MAEINTSGAAYQTLPDPWERRGPIPLDGVLERNRFHPLLVSLFALLIALIGTAVIGFIATIVLLVLNGVSAEQVLQDSLAAMEGQVAAVLGANAVGLFLGMGLIALILARFHASRTGAYLRLRKPDLTALVLALVGLVALTPVVQWAGSINEMVQLPEFLQGLEEMQMELLNQVLKGEVNVVLSLLLVAVTPALCEEVFFRGYLQRNLERSFGAAWGIFFAGFVFGLFHLRMTQLLPLSILGIYLAYLAWRTGSLWIPIVIHFANNAFAVALAEFAKNRPDLDITDIEQIGVPWYIGLVGLVCFSGIVYVLQERTQNQLAEQSAVSADIPVA